MEPTACNAKTAVIAFLALLTISGAADAARGKYEWDNNLYNQVLLDQLDDFFFPWREKCPTTNRLGNRLRFRNEICCGRYEEANMMREDHVREVCHHEVFNATEGYRDGWNPFSADATRDIKERMICLHQCMWKLRGTFEDKYERFFGKVKDAFRDPDVTKDMGYIERSVAKCLPDLDPEKYPIWRQGCSRAYFDFSYCLWEELHADCPEKLWDAESESCERVRRYLERRRARSYS